MAESQTVLVTGGSGYVGGWAVVALLRRGYQVRTTVRDLSREDAVRAMIAGQVDAGDRLAFFEADLLRDDGWERAVKGVDYVLHVASPMPIGEFRGHDVVRPAREGTRRVLEASAEAAVSRVVLTSSTAAAMPADHDVVADETVWTDLPAKAIYNYPRSKTLAEQDAWAFVREHAVGMELTTVLPSNIQGPVLGSDYSASVEIVGLMLRGKLPALPRFGYSIVDVRDLVELELLAMTSPAAAGERFIAAGGFLWFADIARILRDGLGDRAAKVPTREIPNLVIRLGSLFNPELRQMAPELGKRRSASSAKAERLLGWRPRPAAESIMASARSLIDQGLI